MCILVTRLYEGWSVGRGVQPSSSVSSSFILQCLTMNMAELRYFRDVGKCQSTRPHILEQHHCDNQECQKCIRRKISGECTDYGFDGRDTVYSGRYKTFGVTCCRRIHYMVMAGPYTASHPQNCNRKFVYLQYF